MANLFRAQRNNLPTLFAESFWPTEMDRFLEEAFKGMGFRESATTRQIAQFSPKVNISETPEEFKVVAELPGLKDQDIEVTFQDDTLTIKGERKFEKEDKEANYHRIETAYGAFQRMIPFSTRIDEDRIQAEFKDGMLNIRLGKAKEIVDKTRKIKIN